MPYTIDISIDTGEEITFDFGLEAEYTGEYVIDPSVLGEELGTANKKMMGDVTINPIHYDEVTNLGGGITATIGRI